MAKRTYQQHCTLAVALDALAERWTLLIVRDLLPGPRRFSDLFEGLAGISTDLLASRLRALQDLGVLEKYKIRHPAPARLYALTEYGEELRPIIAQLANWGERLLPSPHSDDHRINHRWMLGSIAASYTGGLDDGEYQFEVDGDVLTIHVQDGTAVLRYGPAATTPTVAIRCTTDSLLRAAWTGRADVGESSVLVAGDVATSERLFAVLRAPRPPSEKRDRSSPEARPSSVL